MSDTNQIYIKRDLEELIKKRINSGKAIIVLGPRQTGKTTLIEKIAASFEDYLLLNGDDSIEREKLETQNTEILRQIIGKNKVIIIDEAQRIKNIGLL